MTSRHIREKLLQNDERESGREQRRDAMSQYSRTAKPRMIPVEQDLLRRQEDDTFERDIRPMDKDDKAAVFEEGQEIMLIEELQQKMTMVTEGGEDQKAERKARKSTRKVRQVLLVPTNGDLMMERHRQAAHRALKARALLDEALNWDATIPNRDRLAMDAFTEAGKARLLIEAEKTPELIAMLTDAKMKGEEEAFKATDQKVSDLIPAVKLPADVAGKASASAVKDKLHLYPGLENTVTATAVMMTKDPAMQCFQNMFHPHVTSMSGGYDDYQEGEDADEHVYRAKQYLEFILPDLGEVRENSPKAGGAIPKNLLQKYQQQQLTSKQSKDESDGLAQISSLGFDESHSFDNLSSSDSDNVFSMSSLNEIMDAPIDEFIPEKIMNIPSMKRKKLTIRMSFGGKSINRDETMTSPKAELDQKESPSLSSQPPPSENQVPTVRVVSAQEKKASKTDKRRKSLGFVTMRSAPSSSHGEESQHIEGFFRRFRSMKKRREGECSDHPDRNSNGPTVRMIGPVLSDLSDGHCESIAPSVTHEDKRRDEKESEAKSNTNDKLGDTLRERTPSQETSTKKQEDQLGEGTLRERTPSQETSTKKQEDQLGEGICRPNPVLTEPTPVNDIIELQMVTSKSFEIPRRGRVDNDRYAVGATVDKQDVEDEVLKQVPACTPGSIASIIEMPSRYSPFSRTRSHTNLHDRTPSYRGAESGSSASAGNGKTSFKENSNSLVESTDIIVKSSTQKVNAKPKPSENVTAAEAEESGSLKSGAASTLSGNTTSKKNRKKRTSFMGLFQRKDGLEDGNDSAGSKVNSKQTATQPNKMAHSNQTVTSTQLNKVEQSAKGSGSKTSKKPSSLQVSLKKTKTQQVPQGSILSQKKGKRRKSLTFGKQAGKSQPSPPRATHNTKDASKMKTVQEAKSTEISASNLPNKGASAKASSLQIALQETVEIMATSSGGGKCKSAGCAGRSPASSSTKQKSEGVAQKAKANKKKGKIEKEPPGNKAGRKTRRFDKRPKQTQKQKKKPSSNATPKLTSNESVTTNGSQTARWVKIFPFPIKPKDQTSASSTIISSADPDNGKAFNEKKTLSRVTSPKLSPEVIRPGEDSKKLKCDTRSTIQTTSEQSLITSNPLLPFQLVKQLQEQSKIGTEDEQDVKEAAERSIIRSHTKAIQRSIASDLTSHNGMSTISEKENQSSLATRLGVAGGGVPVCILSRRSSGAPVASNILGQSPRALASNNTQLPPAKAPRHRPDADGINARKKDVREILGLPAAPEFGEERSSSFLSRITQATHRQDLDLPDP